MPGVRAGAVGSRTRIWRPSAVFNPALYGTVYARYDFSSVPVGAISSFADSGPNGLTLTQATGANQPTGVAAAQNGKNVARFNGSSQFLANTSFTIAQPDTVFLVAKTNNAAASQNAFDGATARQVIGINGSLWFIYGGTTLVQAGATDTNWHVFSAVYNGASSQCWKDGTSIITGNPGTAALTSFRLGVASTAASFWNGDIGEFLIYSGSLSTTNRQAVEAALKSKWGTP